MNNVTATSDAGAASGSAGAELGHKSITLSWKFTANINATQAADAQFQSLESALESADGDIRDALHLMMHQTGNTATSAASDLLASAQSGVEVDKQAKLLRTALSTYASAMDVVRSRYEELMSEAIMNRVMVSGDYRSCTLHVEYDESDPFAPYFESLKGKVQTIESLYKLAEKEFADALGKVNTNDLVQLANEGVDYTKSSLIPSSDNYFWTGIGPLSAWTELGETPRTAHAVGGTALSTKSQKTSQSSPRGSGSPLREICLTTQCTAKMSPVTHPDLPKRSPAQRGKLAKFWDLRLPLPTPA